jgi:iron complex outermembrane receptor protein
MSKKIQREFIFFRNFYALKAFIPSSINETDLKNNPEKAAGTWAAAQGLNPMINFFWDWVTSIDFQKKWSVQTNLFKF